jgi:hypothetical protein
MSEKKLETNKIRKKGSNQTDLLFEDNTFHLPQNIFYTDKGFFILQLLRSYLPYAEGNKIIVVL